MRYSYYNPNPYDLRVGDCVIRAITKATGADWNSVFAGVTAEAYKMKDMPSSDAVWGAYLLNQGFKRYSIPNTCPNCYTAADFAADHPRGVYVLAFGGHVATVKDGILFDSFDSSDRVVIYYYYRKD